MTERLAVTLTTDELAALVAGAVREALADRGASDVRTRGLDSEELSIKDVVTLFHLGPKAGAATIRRWREERGFPAPWKRGGNRVRFLRSEIDAWRAAQGTSGPGAVNLPTGKRRKSTGDRAATAAH